MRSFAFILEDNTDRVTAFRLQLAKVASELEPVFFDAADDAIGWLRNHQADASLISLDHDLPIRRTVGGEVHDYGTGRMVSDFLAKMPPTCPVIVHTSNASAGLQMLTALRDAGWPVTRVYPTDDLDWIATAWVNEVRTFCQKGLIAECSE